MAATASAEWDDVWAEFDARAGRRPAPVPAAPAAGPAPRRPRRLLALVAGMAAVACGAVALTPMAAALDLARSFRDGDAPALAAQMDRAALAGAVEEALRRDAATHHPGGLNPFLSAMAGELAGRLAAPEGMAALLRAPEGVAPRQMLRDVVPLGLDRWQVTLASPAAPQRQAQLTLALAGPMRWQVIAAALPSASGR